MVSKTSRVRRRRDGAERRRSFGHGSIGRVVVLFMLAGLGAFVLCGVGLTLAQRHAALREAVRDAEVTTALLATRVVQPALPSAPLGRLDTDRGFDRVIRERVLGAPITQVLIADETGLVVYATAAGLVGQRMVLSAEELSALRTGVAVARRDDGTDPTRFGSGRTGQFLDVSVGLRGPSGKPLLLQTRQPYEVVWVISRAIWLTTLPSLIVALALLYLVKAGFAYRLTRNLRGVQEEREQLLVTSLAAADRERTLIASDLHDGVVQGLAGASYTLSDAGNRVRAAGQPDVADTLADTAGSLRQWVRELRSLIVTVTPPALHSEGLRAALTDLVATLQARGIGVELDVRVSETLTETAESLVYRVAQEAVRNVVRHAHATKVQLIVVEENDSIQLQVTDDGRGFDPSTSTRRQGSVGLNLLAALVQQRGGNLRVESGAGHGTTVTLRLPVYPARHTVTEPTDAAPTDSAPNDTAPTGATEAAPTRAAR
jgi:two-component system, NarL family, sensor kinase